MVYVKYRSRVWWYMLNIGVECGGVMWCILYIGVECGGAMWCILNSFSFY